MVSTYAESTHVLESLSAADLRALEVFRVVCECGGLSAAEYKLSVSQSTMSTQLGKLEKRLGFRLCERGRGGFRLTERGRVLLDAYEQLGNAMEHFRQAAEDLSGQIVGTLRLGLMDNTATDPAFSNVDLIRTFHERTPDVRVEVVQDIQSTLLDGVLTNRLDLAIGAFPVTDRRVDALPLYTERHFIYCGRPHPFYMVDDSAIDLKSLEAANWVRRSYVLEPRGGFPLCMKHWVSTAGSLLRFECENPCRRCWQSSTP